MIIQLEYWQSERLAYSDAQLYRLLVCRLLLEGFARSKSEVDAHVRAMGNGPVDDRDAETDAQLYLRYAGVSVRRGDYASKSEFDEAIRQTGDIEAADKLIAYQNTQTPALQRERLR